MTELRKVQITDIANSNDMTVNSEGRGDVVQHAHPNNGFIHFESASLSASQDFILIDISDTVNYPHTLTDYVHLEWLRIHTDATALTADYSIEVGFLENVDATDGDFHALYDLSGAINLGTSKDVQFNFYPNGARCQASSVANNPTLNDTAFQTDVNLASTLDPTTADTPSGDGDLVLRLSHTAGNIIIGVEASYHTH